MAKVLIVTIPGDFHAQVVKWGLEHCGHDVVEWITTDYPSIEEISLSYTPNGVNIESPKFLSNEEIQDIDSVWFRRFPSSANVDDVADEDVFFVDKEVSTVLESVIQLIAPDAFWVNKPDKGAQADLKPYQLDQAVKCGLAIPETLISNSPSKVREFLKVHKQVIYKPLNPMSWRDDEGKEHVTYTTQINEDDLREDASIHFSSGIFQTFIPKIKEVRATFIGRTCFAGALETPQDSEPLDDWRLARSQGKKTEFNEIEMPPKVREACCKLLDTLDLAYGAFDFLITEQDEWLFLEVNEMGQFLGAELDAGLPVLQAFCDLLINQDINAVKFNSKPVELRLKDYLKSSAFAEFQLDPNLGHAPDKRSVSITE